MTSSFVAKEEAGANKTRLRDSNSFLAVFSGLLFFGGFGFGLMPKPMGVEITNGYQDSQSRVFVTTLSFTEKDSPSLKKTGEHDISVTCPEGFHFQEPIVVTAQGSRHISVLDTMSCIPNPRPPR